MRRAVENAVVLVLVLACAAHLDRFAGVSVAEPARLAIGACGLVMGLVWLGVVLTERFRYADVRYRRIEHAIRDFENFIEHVQHARGEQVELIWRRACQTHRVLRPMEPAW